MIRPMIHEARAGTVLVRDLSPRRFVVTEAMMLPYRSGATLL